MARRSNFALVLVLALLLGCSSNTNIKPASVQDIMPDMAVLSDPETIGFALPVIVDGLDTLKGDVTVNFGDAVPLEKLIAFVLNDKSINFAFDPLAESKLLSIHYKGTVAGLLRAVSRAANIWIYRDRDGIVRVESLRTISLSLPVSTEVIGGVGHIVSGFKQEGSTLILDLQFNEWQEVCDYLTHALNSLKVGHYRVVVIEVSSTAGRLIGAEINSIRYPAAVGRSLDLKRSGDDLTMQIGYGSLAVNLVARYLSASGAYKVIEDASIVAVTGTKGLLKSQTARGYISQVTVNAITNGGQQGIQRSEIKTGLDISLVTRAGVDAVTADVAVNTSNIIGWDTLSAGDISFRSPVVADRQYTSTVQMVHAVPVVLAGLKYQYTSDTDDRGLMRWRSESVGENTELIIVIVPKFQYFSKK